MKKEKKYEDAKKQTKGGKIKKVISIALTAAIIGTGVFAYRDRIKNIVDNIKDNISISESVNGNQNNNQGNNNQDNNQKDNQSNVTKALSNLVYDQNNQYLTWNDSEKDPKHNGVYHIFLNGKEVEQINVPMVDVLKYVKTAGSHTFRIEKEDMNIEGNKKTYNTLEQTVEISKELEQNIKILDIVKVKETNELITLYGRKLLFADINGNLLNILVDCGEDGIVASQERIDPNSVTDDSLTVLRTYAETKEITEFADIDKYNALQSIIDLAKSGAENVPDDIKTYLNESYNISICKAWQEQHHCNKRGDELSYNVIGILRLQKGAEVKYVPCVYKVQFVHKMASQLSDLDAYKEIFFATNGALKYKINKDVGAFDIELEKMILRSGLNWDIDKTSAPSLTEYEPVYE